MTPRFEIFRGRVFDPAVADPAFAGDEDHANRRELRARFASIKNAIPTRPRRGRDGRGSPAGHRTARSRPTVART